MMTTKATTVIDYIVQRIADEGVQHCFGVPGDYAFPVGDAVDRNPNIKWIGCSNELNASYAADGYARARGAAMLSTTYAVGELSAINGVMGAKAERSLVFHVVALPAFTISRLGLQKEARAAIEAIGCPFATTSMEKCIIYESHPQFAGMCSGVLSAEETKKIVEGAELVLDIGGVSFNDETTMGFSTHLDPARFISIGLNDVRAGDQLFGNVRIADVLAALAKLKSPASPYKRTPEGNPSINGKPSDKITMDALYPRYAAFIRSGDNVVLESGSSSFGVPPLTLPDDVQVHIQMLWGSIGWATGASFGIALADPKRKTILITGEGSHQLTANEIGNMGRYGANPIILCLNNDGYMVERALEPNPDWSYNDLAKWRYADVPHALGCTDWFTARVETLGELDAALKAARESKSGAYIEVIGGRMDMPKGLAFAHTRLKELYGEAI